MRWIGKAPIIHILTLFVILAVLTSFSLSGIESFSAVILSPGGEDGLLELVYHFPDQAAEPAILSKADDSGYSIFRFANQRLFDLFGHVGSGSASCFSRFRSHSTEKSFDTKSTIMIKLRI
jgi:hypothetical protein